MLNAILYGFDRRGLLTLRERTCANIHELARQLNSPMGGMRWQWAEVETSAESGETRVVKYTADSLRTLVLESSRVPSLN